VKKIGLWGSIASIIGLTFYFFPVNVTSNGKLNNGDINNTLILSQNNTQSSTSPISPNINVDKGDVTINYGDIESQNAPETVIKKESPPHNRECKQGTFVKENSNFRAVIDGFSQKGKTANISVSVTNNSAEDIKVSLFRN
jgi:hypothetical protein